MFTLWMYLSNAFKGHIDKMHTCDLTQALSLSPTARMDTRTQLCRLNVLGIAFVTQGSRGCQHPGQSSGLCAFPSTTQRGHVVPFKAAECFSREWLCVYINNVHVILDSLFPQGAVVVCGRLRISEESSQLFHETASPWIL